jgi:hypothetical protein
VEVASIDSVPGTGTLHPLDDSKFIVLLTIATEKPRSHATGMRAGAG